MIEPKVAIIIPNWNGKELTLRCLDSIKKLDYKNYCIIVVDNGSTDGSPEAIKNKHPDVILIRNNKNEGFAKAINIGIRKALGIKDVKYIFLLNNDTIIDRNCLRELIKVAESNHKIGILQPKVLNEFNPKIIDTTGHVIKFGRIIDRGHGEIDRGQYDKKLYIIGACAAAALYRRELFEDIGLFDESYETCYEDAELSWRAYKKGWKAIFVPSAIVYHRRKGTINKHKELRHFLELKCLENQVRTVKRHGNSLQKLLFATILARVAVILFLKRLLRKKDIASTRLYLNHLRTLLFD